VTQGDKPFPKPLIVPIFVPHMGCPHQCVFCNQTSITGCDPDDVLSSIVRRIEEVHGEVAHRPPSHGSAADPLRVQPRKPLRRQIAFYGGSFTGIEKKVQIQLLSAAQPLIRKGLIDSIRVSTRPDYIDPQALALLKTYGVRTVELGVQSMAEEVLRRSRRGHTTDDVLQAVDMLHGCGFKVGIQIMVGLPGDDMGRNAYTVDRVIQLNPHFVRIYPTLVLKGTLLEKWYRSGRYRPLSLNGALDLCKRAFLKFTRAGIPVIRLGLQSSPELETKDCVVAGPYHPAFGHLVESSLFYEMASCLMGKSRLSPILRARVSPSDLSNIRGQKNENLYQLKERFGLRDIQIEVDEGQPRGSIILINGTKLDEISYRTLPLS
jgi:histone acetyltransferase (RNA polymerase elongator complex component)